MIKLAVWLAPDALISCIFESGIPRSLVVLPDFSKKPAADVGALPSHKILMSPDSTVISRASRPLAGVTNPCTPAAVLIKEYSDVAVVVTVITDAAALGSLDRFIVVIVN